MSFMFRAVAFRCLAGCAGGWPRACGRRPGARRGRLSAGMRLAIRFFVAGDPYVLTNPARCQWTAQLGHGRPL
jgi:hypothetical protein